MLTGERAGPDRQRIRGRRLEAVITRCLETEPEHWWQSAADLERELAVLPKPNAGRIAAAKSPPETGGKARSQSHHRGG